MSIGIEAERIRVGMISPGTIILEGRFPIHVSILAELHIICFPGGSNFQNMADSCSESKMSILALSNVSLVQSEATCLLFVASEHLYPLEELSVMRHLVSSVPLDCRSNVCRPLLTLTAPTQNYLRIMNQSCTALNRGLVMR